MDGTLFFGLAKLQVAKFVFRIQGTLRMDPISGLILSIMMMAIRALFVLIAFPFRALQRFAYEHPCRTARVVIGLIVSASLTYLLGLPYSVELTFGGGILSLLLGEVA